MLSKIITNVLTALYQPFWFAVLFSVVFMFAFMYFTGIRSAVKQWLSWFRTSARFRRMFFLVFYTIMILFRTLINRNMWINPLVHVIGEWGIYKTNPQTGEVVLYTENLENLALFSPFSFLLLCNYKEKLIGSKGSFWKAFFKSTAISFVFSFGIEMLQLFLQLGTWQLSDIFFNTIGGMSGGLLYFIFYKLKHRKNKNTHPQ